MNPTSTWEVVIQQIETMTLNDQLNLMRYLVDKIQQANNVEYQPSSQSLISMLGSGQGCYTSSEEADQFLRKERDQWDS